MLYTYYLRRHDTETCRFQLVPNPRKAAFISGLTSSDKNWKTRYVLISAYAFTCNGAKLRFPLFWKCVCEYTSFSFPCSLRCPDVDFSLLFCRCSEESSCSYSKIRDKIRVIFGLSEGERNWRNILRGDFETGSYEGTTPPIDSPSFLLVTRRSFEVLGYTPRIPNHLTLTERLYADHVVALQGSC